MKTERDENGGLQVKVSDLDIEKLAKVITGTQPETRAIFKKIFDDYNTGFFAALQDTLSRPEYKDTPTDQLFATDENGKCLYDKVKQEATELFNARQINVTGRETTALYQGLTKVEYAIFDGQTYQGKGSTGTVKRLPIKAEKSGASEAVTTYITIDSKDIKLSRPMKPHEQDVLYASFSLLLKGYVTQTPAMIWHAMGNTKRCRKDDVEMICKAVDHLNATRVAIDNRQEAEAYNYESYYRKKFDLLPVTMDEQVKTNNGKLIGGVITYTTVPKLLKYAVERKNFTTVDKRIAAVPVNRSEMNEAIEHYLRHQVLLKYLKDGTAWETLYAKIGISDKKNIYKDRAQDTTIRILEHYK